MKRRTLGAALVTTAIVASTLLSVGGGATFVALELTTTPQFCRNCHIMEPYYQSWASSSHKDVTCVDCHYEPGLLETFEGKFKALSQLAKYVTQTQGSKPWAEVSDYSCMRSGCHSNQLLEGEIQFGRVRFDHRHHLIGMRRGKTLRCTSCHSQIVQGDHLTVTTSSCFLCHFKSDAESRPIDDCDTCHGPPAEDIVVGDTVFRHSDYLEAGAACADCHGDVTRGAGEVPRERCGSCHNKQEHLERIGDVEFMHRHHVTEHSVTCLDCHLEIQHGLPSREQHGQGGECTDCHAGTHGVASDVYRGTGSPGVPDQPGAMYLARVTCKGCHRAPFPGAPVPPAGATFAADPLACLDCHGPGFEGMAEQWQAEVARAS
ncbi:MAG TPA: cytochrome c3 family protein, partial [Planctomycetota bacterium]|nr:cytochrome c3 family protein [Planctomycetota bacterium]